MKKTASLIKGFFIKTFALYTCISYGMMLLNIATLNAEAPEWSGVALLFSHILLFSALTSLTSTVINAFEGLNSALAHFLKFVLSYGAFYLCFFALGKSVAQPINIVVMSAVFAVIYAVIVGAFAIVTAISSRKRNDSKEYESVYSELSEDKAE